MNLDFSPEEITFRNEVREFIREYYPKELEGIGSREDLTREEFLAWHTVFVKKEWSPPASVSYTHLTLQTLYAV